MNKLQNEPDMIKFASNIERPKRRAQKGSLLARNAGAIYKYRIGRKSACQQRKSLNRNYTDSGILS